MPNKIPTSCLQRGLWLNNLTLKYYGYKKNTISTEGWQQTRHTAQGCKQTGTREESPRRPHPSLKDSLQWTAQTNEPQ